MNNMNFKPSTWKLIISVVIGLIACVYSSKMQYVGGTGPAYVFGISSVIGFFVPLIVVYLIWSLIQKRD
jgi:Na+/pantothenate symporter